MPDTENARWAAADRPDPAKRPLNRDAIVATAVRLADDEGLDAVSMPRLARTLGAAPMSLYRHVPNKDALIGLMLDAAIGAPPAIAGGTVRDGMATWAQANREVFVRHPWTLPLVTGPRRMGPSECAWAEAVLRLVVDDGFRVTDALQALHVVNSYVLGASALRHERAPRPGDIARSGRAAELPLLTEVVGAGPDEASPDGTDPAFEAGLALVLDGVTAHLVSQQPAD